MREISASSWFYYTSFYTESDLDQLTHSRSLISERAATKHTAMPNE